MIPLETDRLILRNWQTKDAAAMHRLNSDEAVMKFFPFRRNRIESDLLLETVKNKIDEKGYSFAAVELKQTGRVVGMAGISDIASNMPFAPALEIGWRFLPEYWGKGYATESALKWLEFSFTALEKEEVVSFAVADNIASTAVMERLGMHHFPELDFDHPSVSDEYPQLKRHVLYAISKDQFNAQNN